MVLVKRQIGKYSKKCSKNAPSGAYIKYLEVVMEKKADLEKKIEKMNNYMVETLNDIVEDKAGCSGYSVEEMYRDLVDDDGDDSFYLQKFEEWARYKCKIGCYDDVLDMMARVSAKT
jgi:hypothetical protein